MFNLAYILAGIQGEKAPDVRKTPCANGEFSSVVFDSRAVTPGALFVALPGEKTDGHHFLVDVARAGGGGALVRGEELYHRRTMLASFPRPWTIIDLTDLAERTGWYPDDRTTWDQTSHRIISHPRSCPVGGREAEPSDRFFFIAVDDPQTALWRLAQYHRAHFALPVVGVTGSVGKTTTKESIANILSRHYRILKSERSYNTAVSIATTILQLTAQHQAAVFELGMWAPGEIRQLAHLIQPSVGVVTNVGVSHLERMGSIEAIADAKAELVESLPPSGVAVLNADDEHVSAMAKRTNVRVFRYGVHEQQSDMRAEEIVSYGLQGIGFFLSYQDQRTYVRSPMLGRHAVYTAMASASVGVLLGVPWETIIAGLQTAIPHGRMQVRQVGHDEQSFLIIDDTYNASPASMLAALHLLSECPGRHLAVLGDMLELGTYAEEAHRTVGRQAASVLQVLIGVGPLARWIVQEARDHISAAYVAETKEEAIALAKRMVQPGDVILVKGSRALAMETIVEALSSIYA